MQEFASKIVFDERQWEISDNNRCVEVAIRWLGADGLLGQTVGSADYKY